MTLGDDLGKATEKNCDQRTRTLLVRHSNRGKGNLEKFGRSSSCSSFSSGYPNVL